jgi:hypothetical protein
MRGQDKSRPCHVESGRCHFACFHLDRPYHLFSLGGSIMGGRCSHAAVVLGRG